MLVVAKVIGCIEGVFQVWVRQHRYYELTGLLDHFQHPASICFDFGRDYFLKIVEFGRNLVTAATCIVQ